MRQIKRLVIGFSITLMLSGCHSIYNSEYYIPVDNQKGDAQPLSKNDVIRAIMPYSYIGSIYTHDIHTIRMYNMAAKQGTEKQLQKLGYTTVDTMYYPDYKSHPTVIALVDSAPIEGSLTSETHTWDAPVFTDEMGRTTLSEKQGVTINYNTYYYKVKLVRPEGKDNPLFQCKNKVTGYCIAPSNPSNYKVIFSGYATITTNNTVSTINLDHLTAAVFYNYPNMMGKKWVYFTNTGYTPIYVTEPNGPKPTDKK